MSNPVDSFAEGVGKAVGEEVIKICSDFGRTMITYSLSVLTAPSSNVPQQDGKPPGEVTFPPYAVIGVGRCGSHITTELARIVVAATGSSPSPSHQTLGRFLASLVTASKGSPLTTPEPMMVVGDIDETTFDDIFKVLGQNGNYGDISRRILKIDYRPIAEGGTGHVPVFGQFLTRGLLLLSPNGAEFIDRPWQAARAYLIDSCSQGANTPRLIFYVLSAGGGTGAGSAAELMRAQRFAINVSPSPDPQIYFAGVAIIPADLSNPINRRHLINTGRTIVQYLAELNLQLSDEVDYSETPKFKYAMWSESKRTKRPIRPWDGLMIISNDVMLESTTSSYDAAEKRANEYAAQQMLALAASQIRSEEQRKREPEADKKKKAEVISTGTVNFESTRLDPHDLQTALRGPFSVCFSVASTKELLVPDNKSNLEKECPEEIDRMFLRAIGLPCVQDRDDFGGVIEGISVLPDERSKYAAVIESLMKHLATDPVPQGKSGQDLSLGNTVNRNVFKREHLKVLQAIPFFGQCPRVVFVFTAPERSNIPGTIRSRICQLLAWSMPNLLDARFAIVRSALPYYTLSIYAESSVVLCPDIQSAIKNYIRLCWRTRLQKPSDFLASYEQAVGKDLSKRELAEIETWIGSEELYRTNVPDFQTAADDWQARWISSVNSIENDVARKKELLGHQVRECLLNPQEIAAALRFLSYVSHLYNPGVV